MNWGRSAEWSAQMLRDCLRVVEHRHGGCHRLTCAAQHGLTDRASRLPVFYAPMDISMATPFMKVVWPLIHRLSHSFGGQVCTSEKSQTAHTSCASHPIAVPTNALGTIQRHATFQPRQRKKALRAFFDGTSVSRLRITSSLRAWPSWPVQPLLELPWALRGQQQQGQLSTQHVGHAGH